MGDFIYQGEWLLCSEISCGFLDVASHMCSMPSAALYTYSIADRLCQGLSIMHIKQMITNFGFDL